MLPLPICVKCKQEMKCIKNEFIVKDKASGKFQSTIWFGDLYKCCKCNNQIAAGFGTAIEPERNQHLLDEAMPFNY